MRSAGRPGAVTRQATAEELLAEFQRVLESAGYLPSAAIPAAAGPRKSTDACVARDSSVDLSADEPPNRSPTGSGDARGERHVSLEEATRVRPRRWKLAVSALALGLAAVAGVGLALVPTAPAPKTAISAVPTQRQSNVQPPVEESVVTSGVSVKDSPRADHAEARDASVEIETTESKAKALAPLDAQPAADGSNATAVGTSAATPVPATTAAKALTAAQSSIQEGSVGPETPIATMSTNPAVSGLASETPGLHDRASAAAVKLDVATPPAAKVDGATAPTANKTPGPKFVEKSVKAKMGATAAQIPYPPLRPAPPAKAAVPPTVPAAGSPAPVPAAPAAPIQPPSFAAQSVNQLTNAFGYITHLPSALLGRATGPAPEAQ
jgi:hypothetical protein